MDNLFIQMEKHYRVTLTKKEFDILSEVCVWGGSPKLRKLFTRMQSAFYTEFQLQIDKWEDKNPQARVTFEVSEVVMRMIRSALAYVKGIHTLPKQLSFSKQDLLSVAEEFSNQVKPQSKQPTYFRMD